MAYPYSYPYQPPMAPAQQPSMTQPIQPQPMIQQPAPQVRTVYSEAEARSAQIPIDGSICIFTDASNGRIYTKRFDYSTGAFPFEVYLRTAPAETSAPEYITRQQFDEWRSSIEDALAAASKPVKGGKANAAE